MRWKDCFRAYRTGAQSFGYYWPKVMMNEKQVSDAAVMRDLSTAGSMLQRAGVPQSRVHINGIPLSRLTPLQQWAFDLGYREEAHMAEHEGRKITG